MIGGVRNHPAAAPVEAIEHLGGPVPQTHVDADAILAGVRIIDCDAHFTEPPDLWSSRAPASRRDDVPVMRTVDGRSSWYLGGHVMAGIGGNTIEGDHQKRIGLFTIEDFDDVDPASWDVGERLNLLDKMGVFAQILYPNAMGFASNVMYGIDDVEQRNLIQGIYNDYLMDLQEASSGRLFPQAVLPTWDMDLTVREMTRLAERGARGYTISDKPHTVGLPDLDHDYFAPMWSLADELGCVLNFHIGSGGAARPINAVQAEAQRSGNPTTMSNPELYWESFGPQRRLALLATSFYMSNARIIANLCMSGMFDQYPNVKIASAESGIGWIPFILEALEYQLDEMVTEPAELAVQERRPTEYFRDHIYAMFWFERSAMKFIEDIGVNNVLIETDIPHPTCTYPGARERLAETVAGLDPYVRRRILQDNAAELYKIDLPD